MRSWNIIDEFILANSTGTIIKKNKRVPFGIITNLMSKMEEIDFSIDYSEGIQEIYFTYLGDGLHGDYNISNSSIRLSCKDTELQTLHKTFLHELGHHCDEINNISCNHKIKKEWEKSCWKLFDSNKSILDYITGVSEFVADGFAAYHMSKDTFYDTKSELFLTLKDLDNNKTK